MIITDTNFWYDLTDGNIDMDGVKGLPIAVTAVTILELISTPKLKTEEGRKYILKVCRTIRNMNPIYIRDMPYEWAARYYLGKKVMKRIHLNRFFAICDNGFDEIDYEKFVEERKNVNDGFKSDLEAQVNENRKKPEIKGIMKDVNKAADSSTNDFIIEIARVLNINSRKVHMQRILKKGKGLNFYVRARAQYNRKLHLDKGYGPARGDQLDLANLLYVKEGDMYLTSDDKWKNIIKEINEGHRLYELYKRELIP